MLLHCSLGTLPCQDFQSIFLIHVYCFSPFLCICPASSAFLYESFLCPKEMFYIVVDPIHFSCVSPFFLSKHTYFESPTHLAPNTLQNF